MQYLKIMAKKRSELDTELRIKGVSTKTKEEVMNIAGHLGITMSAFLKPKLKEIINTYPEKMREPQSLE